MVRKVSLIVGFVIGLTLILLFYGRIVNGLTLPIPNPDQRTLLAFMSFSDQTLDDVNGKIDDQMLKNAKETTLGVTNYFLEVSNGKMEIIWGVLEKWHVLPKSP